MVSLMQSQLSLPSQPLQLNSASSPGILHGNIMQTALEASRKLRDDFLCGCVENTYVELLILSEVLNWIPTLHSKSFL